MEKFYLRCSVDKKLINLTVTGYLHRNVKSLHDELRWLYNRIMEQRRTRGSGGIYPVTSEFDRVFPAKKPRLGYWSKRGEYKTYYF